MRDAKRFSRKSLDIDTETEINTITAKLKKDVARVLKRRGAVVGVSGGIDSAVVLALCTRAVGPDRVLAVMMPERESDPRNVELGATLIDALGVHSITEDLSDALQGFGCYTRRDQAVRRVFPEYNSRCKVRIGLPVSALEGPRLNIFEVTIVLPSGEERSARLPPREYLEIVAASNLKQRSRMCMLYHHAEARHYAVAGTGNRNECQLGFFVKFGDGGADLLPIAHLFKTQVYQLAAALHIPHDIIERPPTPDTYTAEHTHENFFYRAPFEILDPVWYGWELGVPSEEIAESLDLTVQQVNEIIEDVRRKKRTSEYLRHVPF